MQPSFAIYIFRINSTHLFMAGGLAQTFNLVNDFAEEDYVRDSTGCLRASNATLVDGIGGGTYFDRAWIFDGKDWHNITHMSVARDQPACSLVEMDDGEVSPSVHMPICPSVHMPICPSVRLSFCPSVRPSVCFCFFISFIT
jgi:hypothetical protein